MEKKRKLIAFPVELIEMVQEFADENYINTFTGAVIELIRRGLESSKKNGL